MGGWWRWALVSPDGVAPSRMVSASASVNLLLHHKSKSSLLAPAYPGGPGKRAVKRLWCVVITDHHGLLTSNISRHLIMLLSVGVVRASVVLASL